MYHSPAILEIPGSEKKPQVGKWIFYCPGCEYSHAFLEDGHWRFDGNEECPTFEPSLLHRASDGAKFTCHIFVRGGKIQYLTDCTHKLAGQTVDMVKY